MTIQKLPLVGLEDINHQRRVRETLNQIIDAMLEGEFIATVAAGTGGAPTGTVKYRVANRLVTLWLETGLYVNVSTANTMTLSTLPPTLRPAAARIARCAGITDVNAAIGGCTIGADGVLTFFLETVAAGIVTANYTAFDATSWPKGLMAGWMISYLL